MLVSIKPLIRNSLFFLKRCFRIRIISPKLVPKEDNECSGNHFRATGIDPQFDIVLPEESALEEGWLIASYSCLVDSDDAIFVPKLYPSTEVPQDEGNVITLGPHFSGKVVHLFWLKQRINHCRFDPFDLDYPKTVNPFKGDYSLTRFKVVQLGSVPLFIFAIYTWCISVGKYLLGNRAGFLNKKEQTDIINGNWFYLFIQKTSDLLWNGESLDYWYNHYKKFREKSTPQHQGCLKIIYVIDLKNSKIKHAFKTLFSIYRQSSNQYSVSIKSGGVALYLLFRSVLSFRGIEVCKETNKSEASFIYDKLVYYAPLVSGDSIAPQTTGQLISAIHTEKPDLIYTDSIKRDSKTNMVVSVETQTAFSIDGFFSDHKIGRFIIYSKRLYSSLRFELADYGPPDLVLKALPYIRIITHVPQLLLETKLSSNSMISTQSRVVLLTSFLKSRGYQYNNIRSNPIGELLSVRYNTKCVDKKVLIIIPTKNGYSLLKRTIESIQKTTSDGLYHLLVVNHDSDEQKLLSYLDKISNKATVLHFSGDFNYSKINNYAVNKYSGYYDYILFLNNDVEAIESCWLESMIDKMAREEVGVVGATLLYPDHTIQHAGVILGCKVADHPNKKMNYINRYRNKCDDIQNYPLIKTREFCAVTAACMLVRRTSFEQAGGFDEKLSVGFGDIDLCLRIKSNGNITLLDAEAVLIHHESKTRGIATNGDPHPSDTLFFLERYHSLLNETDPWHHPLLSKEIYHNRLKRGVRSTIFDGAPGCRTVDLSTYFQKKSVNSS